MAKMYFVALVAPADINRQVLEWKNYMKDHYGCVVALRSPAHITLVPPFWIDESFESKFEEILIEFSANHSAIEIHLQHFGGFKPRVIYVAVAQNERLQDLQSSIQKFMIARNIPSITPDDRPFHPHVSIAARDLHKKAFHEAWGVFKEKKFDASWMATGISLLRHNEKNWEVIFTSQFAAD